MTHEMHLQDEPFTKIKKGTKTVELRLFDMKRKVLKVGDTIIFTNRDTNETIDVIITALKKYPDFNELYQNYDKVALGYNAKDEAHPEDMNKYYSKEEIKKYGVIAIEVKLKR